MNPTKREWRPSYRHESGDLIDLFYNPTLACAVQYDRMTGYFSADALALAARAKIGREQNAGAARSGNTFSSASTAVRRVVSPITRAGEKKPAASLTGTANDFGALERLRKLAFADTVPAPKIPEQLPLELPDAADDNEDM